MGKAGVGSAVNDTTRQTGGALGVAVLGSIFALRYHAVIGSASGIPADVSAQVQDSIGKALEAAQQLGARKATWWPRSPAAHSSSRCGSSTASPPESCSWPRSSRGDSCPRAPADGVLFEEEIELAEAISVTDA